MYIEVITTPNKTLNETGFGDITACRHVARSIKKMGHSSRVSSCSSTLDLEYVLKRNPDLVVLGSKYIQLKNDQKIWLSEYFSDNSIPYCGSSKDSLEYDSDKILAKQCLQKKGIPTAEYFLATPDSLQGTRIPAISYPVFIKPNSSANGNDINASSIVSCYSDFKKKVNELYKLHEKPILVEEYLPGKEYTVAILNTDPGNYLISAVEVVPPKDINGHRILSQSVKAENTEIIKKITDKNTHLKVRKLAFEAYQALDINSFARIDIKENAKGTLFFMEINLIPGLALGTSYFPEAFKIDLGLTYEEIVSHIIKFSLTKTKTASRIKIALNNRLNMTTPHVNFNLTEH